MSEEKRGSWYLTYTIEVDSGVKLEECYRYPRGYHSKETFKYERTRRHELKASNEKEALIEAEEVFGKQGLSESSHPHLEYRYSLELARRGFKKPEELDDGEISTEGGRRFMKFMNHLGL